MKIKKSEYSVKRLSIGGLKFPEGFDHKFVLRGNREDLIIVHARHPSAIVTRVRNDIPVNFKYLDWLSAVLDRIGRLAWGSPRKKKKKC